MSRRLRVTRTLAASAVLVLALPSCRMEMGVGTTLRSDGSGTFTIAVAMDREFIQGLAEADAATGGKAGDPAANAAAEFERFFDSLRAKGWTTKTSRTPAGDVALRGSCAFPTPEGFDRCLGALSSAEGGSGAGRLRDVGLSFDFGTARGFLKTRAYFTGTVNLAGPSDERTQRALGQVKQFAGEVFRFEVRADLPGSVRITGGSGQVERGVAVWRPQVGERLSLRAESSAFNPAALLVLLLPAIAALGLGAWGLARRRGRAAAAADDGGFVATPHTEPEVPAFVPSPPGAGGESP